MKVYYYGDSAPVSSEATERLRTWCAISGAAAGRVVWFQSTSEGARTRLMLKTLTNRDKHHHDHVMRLVDCDVAETFPAFAEQLAADGFTFLYRRLKAGLSDGPILVTVEDRHIVGAIGPLGILLDATGTRIQPPQYFAAYGLLLSAMAVGGIIGGYLAPRPIGWLGDRLTVLVGLLIQAVTWLMVAATHNPVVAGVAVCILWITTAPVTDPPAGSISVFALRGEQWCPGPGVVGVEVSRHVLDEPAQGPAGIIDQRHPALAGSAAGGAFAVADVQLAEPAQVPLDVLQVQAAGLVDPQADLGHQPGGDVVAGTRGKLPAAREFLAPAREQGSDLRIGGRDAQCGVFGPARAVHLIDRALGHPAGLLAFGLTGDQSDKVRTLHKSRSYVIG